MDTFQAKAVVREGRGVACGSQRQATMTKFASKGKGVSHEGRGKGKSAHLNSLTSFETYAQKPSAEFDESNVAQIREGALPETATSQKQLEDDVAMTEIPSSQPREAHQELAEIAVGVQGSPAEDAVEISQEMGGGSISAPLEHQLVENAVEIAPLEQQLVDMYKQVKLKNEVDEPEDDDVFPVDEMLERASKTGFSGACMVANSALEKRFKRYLKQPDHADEQVAYDKMKRDEKLKKRQEWTMEIYDEYKARREHSEVERKRKRIRGRWVNMDRMIHLEGGHHSLEVVKGCINIAKSCITQGPDWVRVNRRSGRIEFRYIEEMDDHESEEAWKKTKVEGKDPISRSGKGQGGQAPPVRLQEIQGAAAPQTPLGHRALLATQLPALPATPLGLQPATPIGLAPHASPQTGEKVDKNSTTLFGASASANVQQVAQTKAAGKARSKTGHPKGKAKAAGKRGKKLGTDSADMSNRAMIAAALQDYTTQKTKADHMLKQISGADATPEWSWAAAKEICEPLHNVMRECTSAVNASVLFSAALLIGLDDLELKMEPQVFEVQIQASLSSGLVNRISALEQEVTALCSMHQCRSQSRLALTRASSATF